MSPGIYAQSDATQRHEWDVERIWRLAEDLPVIEIPIESIVGLDAVTWFSETQLPTIRAIVGHAARMRDADLSYPPILTADGRVFDGMHRIARHLLDGHSQIRVKRFAQNPPPDRVILK